MWKDDEEWPPHPAEVSKELLDSDKRVKKEKMGVGAAVVLEDFWSSLFQRYSNWVAWLIRAFRIPAHPQSQIEVCRNSKKNSNCSPTPLSLSEVTEAAKRIVKAVQAQSFPVEIDKTVTTGRLARLKQFEDEVILGVGERLKHSELQYDAKYPLILPGKHPVTKL